LGGLRDTFIEKYLAVRGTKWQNHRRVRASL
jgi:hypothetical protein